MISKLAQFSLVQRGDAAFECYFCSFGSESSADFFRVVSLHFFLERVLGLAIRFVKHFEDAGEWEVREFVGGELVGHVPWCINFSICAQSRFNVVIRSDRE